ncbi:carboxylesterase/lipase family protein [Chondromyces crocatus]|uniref:Carboxylic ester hydrolase n=1 Tax=Chondromyces crocatus TaxID=52 RepID=A0A0K1ELI1_CHOCO|nr:carboxylesterase family protein [Chondromyces crocatus]AKT41532.1 carboxylesterase [Chondromyces crocatus]
MRTRLCTAHASRRPTACPAHTPLRTPTRGLRALRFATLLPLAALGAVACGSEPPVTEDPLRVTTDLGEVRGRLKGEVVVFDGIPYAAPPVGELRFRSPRPAEPWAGLRDATRPGSACPQAPHAFTGFPGSAEEDCLYLNVTMPRDARPGASRPVMVWIHGGAFVEGFGHGYDATDLATAGDVVVVTLNYRLGSLAFLSHPALHEGSEHGTSGNLAIEDQQAALRWVQRNAEAFGGDPARVTLFGESAGATSVSLQLLSPDARGLFAQAIAQSGSAMVSWPEDTLPPSAFGQQRPLSPGALEAAWQPLVSALGCDDPATVASCLRALPVSAFLEAQAAGNHGAPLLPAFESALLPRTPREAFSSGAYLQVPMISGQTRDEASWAIALLYDLAGKPITPEQYVALVEEHFKGHATEVLTHYPLTAYASPSKAWSAIQSDLVSSCHTLAVNRFLAANAPTYTYDFADPDAPPFIPIPGVPRGPAHGADLPFLFPASFDPSFTPAQEKLSEQMLRYWVTFAETGHPDAEGAPPWPRFAPAAEATLTLVPAPQGPHPEDFEQVHHCDFWRSISP